MQTHEKWKRDLERRDADAPAGFHERRLTRQILEILAEVAMMLSFRLYDGQRTEHRSTTHKQKTGKDT